MSTRAQQSFANTALTRLGGSTILKIAYEVQDLAAAGKRVANLTIGDFDANTFHIPTELEAGIIHYLQQGETTYPPMAGVTALRKAICTYFGQEHYTHENVVVSSGVRPMIYATYMAALDPGDAVIYPIPSWNSRPYVALAGARHIALTTGPENNFLLTAEAIAPHIGDAHLIALCSPANPTGTVYDEARLRALCELVLAENNRRTQQGRKPLYVLYDQVYWRYMYGLPHVHPVGLMPEMADWTVYTDGVSKSFGATGLRLGWGIGPKPLMTYISNLIGFIGAWAPKPIQFAAADFLADSAAQQRYLDGVLAITGRRLNTLHAAIERMRAAGLPIRCLKPQGGLFLSIEVTALGARTPDGATLNTAEDLQRYMLHEGCCAFIPFAAFDAPEAVTWFRAAVSNLSDDDLAFGMEQLERALAALRF